MVEAEPQNSQAAAEDQEETKVMQQTEEEKAENALRDNIKRKGQNSVSLIHFIGAASLLTHLVEVLAIGLIRECMLANLFSRIFFDAHTDFSFDSTIMPMQIKTSIRTARSTSRVMARFMAVTPCLSAPNPKSKCRIKRQLSRLYKRRKSLGSHGETKKPRSKFIST